MQSCNVSLANNYLKTFSFSYSITIHDASFSNLVFPSRDLGERNIAANAKNQRLAIALVGCLLNFIISHSHCLNIISSSDCLWSCRALSWWLTMASQSLRCTESLIWKWRGPHEHHLTLPPCGQHLHQLREKTSNELWRTRSKTVFSWSQNWSVGVGFWSFLLKCL